MEREIWHPIQTKVTYEEKLKLKPVTDRAKAHKRN